jgi:hypothetical protein
MRLQTNNHAGFYARRLWSKASAKRVGKASKRRSTNEHQLNPIPIIERQIGINVPVFRLAHYIKAL